MKNSYDFDMDGVLVNYHDAYTGDRINEAMNREWIANLAPFTNNIAIAKALIASGNKVYISSLAASEGAKQGKLEWLASICPRSQSIELLLS